MAGLQLPNGRRITHYVKINPGYAEPVNEGFSWRFLFAGPFWFLQRRMWQMGLISSSIIVLGYYLAGSIAGMALLVAFSIGANTIHRAFLERTGYEAPDPDMDLRGCPREGPGLAVHVVYLLLSVAFLAYTYTSVQQAVAEATRTLSQAGL